MKKRQERSDFIRCMSLWKAEVIEGMFEGSWKSENRLFIVKNWKKQGVDRYVWREILLDLSVGIGLVGLLAWLFYRSIGAFLCLFPLALGHVWLQGKEREKKRHEQMEYRFVDALAALSGALKAGYSVEHALIEAGKELEVLYGLSAPICQEFRLIRSKLEMNRQPEDALMEFAVRTRLEDAVVFAEVFAIANRVGGDMVAVVGKTSEMIVEKLRAEQEIRTLIRARQFEQKIMNGMPLAILAYMEVVSPGYLSPVYGNVGGVLIMSIGLVLYGFAYVMGKRITEIEV